MTFCGKFWWLPEDFHQSMWENNINWLWAAGCCSKKMIYLWAFIMGIIGHIVCTDTVHSPVTRIAT